MLEANHVVQRKAGADVALLAKDGLGHGIQQPPAVDRDIAALITTSRCPTLDLTPLGYERLLINDPICEANII